MSRENKTGMDMEWLEIWMKQGNVFLESAQKNLKEIFGSETLGNPQDHWKQIEGWINNLNKQWQSNPMGDQQGIYQDYWKWVAKTCTDATNLMSQEWLKRSQDDHKIQSVRELYELWLECCQDAYRNSVQSNSFQKTYTDMMNATLKLWKSAMPDKG